MTKFIKNYPLNGRINMKKIHHDKSKLKKSTIMNRELERRCKDSCKEDIHKCKLRKAQHPPKEHTHTHNKRERIRYFWPTSLAHC